MNEDSRSSRAPTKFDNGEEGFQIEDNIYDIYRNLWVPTEVWFKFRSVRSQLHPKSINNNIIHTL